MTLQLDTEERSLELSRMRERLATLVTELGFGDDFYDDEGTFVLIVKVINELKADYKQSETTVESLRREVAELQDELSAVRASNGVSFSSFLAAVPEGIEITVERKSTGVVSPHF